MQVTRKSIFTGVERTLELPITSAQLQDWENGKGLIQEIMPELTASQREFVMTGVTDDEWDNFFNEEDI